MDILTLLLILSTLSLLCAWLYSRDFLKKVVVDKSVHLSQVITAIVPTSIFVSFFIFSYISIISDSATPKYSYLDGLVLIMLVLFISFALLGVGIHFTGKCLSENLKKSQLREIRRSGYVFHILLGHHVTFILGMFSLFLLAAFNFYHPSVLPASPAKILLVASCGFLWALSWAFSFTYAPIKRKLYIYLGGIACIIILSLFILSSFSISYFIYSIFFFSTIFFTTAMVTLIYGVEKLSKKHIRLILTRGKLEEEFNLLYYKDNS